jgi:hypothetical protein
MADGAEASPRFATEGTWDRMLAAVKAQADAAGEVDWNRQRRLHDRPRPSALCDRRASRRRGRRSDAGATSNDKNRHRCRDEPGHHALGLSRGGLSTRTHAAVDGGGRPLAILLTPGQASDAPTCVPVVAAIRVQRVGPARPKSRPERVLGDKARSSRAIRTHLRQRGITSVIPEPGAQNGPPWPPRLRRRATRQLRPEPRPQRRRTYLQPDQETARTGDQIRQARRHLPTPRRPRSSPHVAKHLKRHALAGYSLKLLQDIQVDRRSTCEYIVTPGPS